MKVQDFGRFDGSITVFGGGYSNWHAVSALIEARPDAPMFSTGDSVGYCAQPNETVAAMTERGVYGIAGNCERQATSGADECGCGFEDGSACDLLSRGWYPYLLAKLDAESHKRLAALPDMGILQQDHRRYAVIHGGATANNRFLWPSSANEDFEREIAAIETMIGPVNGVLAGHSGLAFHRVVGDHQWINAGAVGLPSHDGRSETRYAVLEAGEVTFHRLAYNHYAARTSMEEQGLTQGYQETLTTGIWPSEDVLPLEHRR